MKFVCDQALKEQQCEREPPVDVDVVYDDIKLDERDLAILQKPKKPPSHGKGKDLETFRFMLSAPPPSSCQQKPTGPRKSDAHHRRQDWDDEDKLENSKRKLHQGYQEFQNRRKKIQLLEVKNLPLPSKPQRGRVLSKTSSRKCPEPSDFLESQQNPKGPTKSTHHLHHRRDWDDEEKLENSKKKLHQSYQELQNKRKKIQILDIKNLPMPPKPQRGRVLNKN
ncbi:unnamed protein product [Prunus armeniaca]